MMIVKWTIRLLPLAYMALIWILSSLPDNAVVELPSSSIDRFLKESLHLIEFGILHVLLAVAYITTGKFSARTNLICALIAASYGLLDEIHQYFVPYRSATLIDFVKDVIGVITAWWIIRAAYFHKRFPVIAAVLQKLKQI
ncbi:hypothetical protein CVD25_00225 [Bacillus canaveralius]|uniref:VanZ-like domain-containing protein n=1 Tax=Bacillus canaveralius TaxID=1403243 RepID=A0A2N5GQE3_9BACI|nr:MULTISPECIES: VanZ family protein [Bacillus]PLR85095.1 hypothetical protein CU635_04760 [Bacillus canaveralius]PLR85451.1 hypothetical protein CVD23_08725 [Bacillus sp. V33-4]PLS00907.1 hypothetical protein CVD25_00225 [Bacillus canaveralius]RSK54226.1 hypothetical protein EJA13_06540 [Bacillus canaveralius]